MLITTDKINIEENAHWFIFVGDRIVANKQHMGVLTMPWHALDFAHHYSDQLLKIGEHDGKPCYVIDAGQEQLDIGSLDLASLRSVFMSFDEKYFALVARAWQLTLFRRTHRYCGQCGSSMQSVDWEIAMQCHTCGHRCYPRISPSIIVAIRRQGKILLAQGKPQKERKMYSVLAGFVESGESLEHAVHREVFEEVGITIKGLEYFGSQPWPFPHSIMVGFLADYDSGNIVVDGKEILEADWYDVNELPFVPPVMSIAGQLIEEVKRRVLDAST